MQIDAVQIIPGLLGRDRESGAVDQGAQLAGRQREIDAAARRLAITRIILRRQAGEGEGRAARAQRPSALRPPLALQLDLGALAQFADDVVERVRRRGGPAFALDLAPATRSTISRSISVALSASLPGFGAQQHVRENRDRRPPFDDALHMAQRLEEGRPFDGQFHVATQELADRREAGPGNPDSCARPPSRIPADGTAL